MLMDMKDSACGQTASLAMEGYLRYESIPKYCLYGIHLIRLEIS